MAKDQLIAGIDIGGSKIRTVIAEVEPESGSLNVIGVGITDSHGIRKGNIVDINETIKNISQSLENAERMAGESVDSVFVSVSGNHLKAIPSKGVVAVGHDQMIDGVFGHVDIDGDRLCLGTKRDEIGYAKSRRTSYAL